MRNRMLAILAVSVLSLGAFADLASEFATFTSQTWQIGTSGSRSSYHTPVKNGQGVTGPTDIATLGPDLVSYPNGVGMVPSPGLASGGRFFDQGVLGVKISGNNLVVQVASGMDPRVGKLFNGTWYNSGDMFVSVRDSSGVKQFSLLNRWARTGGGNLRSLGSGSFFDNARSFHNGREGNLVRLNSDSNLQLTGSTGGYTASSAPNGLDVRAFAKGGTDLGATTLSGVTTVNELGQNWFIQSWTLPLSLLTSDAAYAMSFHQTMSCGNDQIGTTIVKAIPAPGAALLGCLGLALISSFRRRMA